MTEEQIRKIADAVTAALRANETTDVCSPSDAAGDACCSGTTTWKAGGAVVCICVSPQEKRS